MSVSETITTGIRCVIVDAFPIPFANTNQICTPAQRERVRAAISHTFQHSHSVVALYGLLDALNDSFKWCVLPFGLYPNDF